MIRRLFYICLMASLPLAGLAAEKEEPGSAPNPYSECGIGAAIFSNTGWAAAISNVIWDLGTTAITSATMSPGTCSAKKVKTARLILETLPSLEKDIAVGGGEYLTALNETMECDRSVHSRLNEQFRLSYADVIGGVDYGDSSRIERATDLYNSVKDVTEASNSCNVTL